MVSSTSKFNKKKSRILEVFTKTKEELIKVINQEQVYVEKLEQNVIELNQEIDLSKNSIESSKSILENINNLLNF
mgnify:FL=1